ncbi:MAG: SGNH/GDSL hydrolase family protein [Planctomycetota bacterium]|nr:SGNH/GDSL hydrolase family protein [Planctomycetota bacterium]
MGRPLRRLAGLLLGALVALGIAEGWLRAQLRTDLFGIHVPGNEIHMRPEAGGLNGISGPSVQRISSLGLRGRERDAADLRSVLCVGGSTTACEYLSDGETWPDLLAGHLAEACGGPVWVGNAGASGHRALDHVTALGRLLDALQPLDAVVVLAGINDTSHAVLHRGTPPEDSPASSPEQLRRVFAVQPLELSLWPPSKTALATWLERRKRASWDAAALEDPDGKAYALRRQLRREGPLHDEPMALDPTFERAYREHLEWCVGAVQRRGATPVLLTQPTLWTTEDAQALERCWFGWVDALPWEGPSGYVDLAVLNEVQSRLNSATRAAAATTGALLVDLERRLAGDASAFYDDCHFTESGAMRVAEEVAEVLSLGDGAFRTR